MSHWPEMYMNLKNDKETIDKSSLCTMYCMTMGILGSLHLLQLSNIVNTPKGVMSKIFSSKP